MKTLHKNQGYSSSNQYFTYQRLVGHFLQNLKSRIDNRSFSEKVCGSFRVQGRNVFKDVVHNLEQR